MAFGGLGGVSNSCPMQKVKIISRSQDFNKNSYDFKLLFFLLFQMTKVKP